MTSRTQLEACEVARISRATMTRWLQDQGFQTALKDAESEAMGSLTRALMALGADAVKALEDAIKDPSPAAAAIGGRIRAADIVLSKFLSLKELVDLEERVSQLEKAVQK